MQPIQMSDFPPPKILEWWDARVLDHQRLRWLTVERAVELYVAAQVRGRMLTR